MAYITIASFAKAECHFLVRQRPLRQPDRHFDYLRDGVPERLIGVARFTPRETSTARPAARGRGYSGGTSVGIFICRAASFEKVRSGSVPLRRAPIFASVPTR